MLTLLNCRNYLQKEGTSQFSYCTVEERGKGDLYQGVTKLAFPSVPIFSWHKEKNGPISGAGKTISVSNVCKYYEI